MPITGGDLTHGHMSATAIYSAVDVRRRPSAGPVDVPYPAARYDHDDTVTRWVYFIHRLLRWGYVIERIGLSRF